MMRTLATVLMGTVGCGTCLHDDELPGPHVFVAMQSVPYGRYHQIMDGLRGWRPLGFTFQLSDGARHAPSEWVTVVWSRVDSSSVIGGADVDRRTIYIREDADPWIEQVAAHEFGHVMGLDHLGPDGVGIMNMSTLEPWTDDFDLACTTVGLCTTYDVCDNG